MGSYELLSIRVDRNIERARRAKTEGYVYFIASRPYVKIGYSQRPGRYRLADVEGMNPHPCELLGEVSGGLILENELHVRFQAYRHRREWYCLTPELEAEIAALLTNARVTISGSEADSTLR